jgi:hypothetical protein
LSIGPAAGRKDGENDGQKNEQTTNFDEHQEP